MICLQNPKPSFSRIYSPLLHHLSIFLLHKEIHLLSLLLMCQVKKLTVALIKNTLDDKDEEEDSEVETEMDENNKE